MSVALRVGEMIETPLRVTVECGHHSASRVITIQRQVTAIGVRWQNGVPYDLLETVPVSGAMWASNVLGTLSPSVGIEVGR